MDSEIASKRDREPRITQIIACFLRSRDVIKFMMTS